MGSSVKRGFVLVDGELKLQRTPDFFVSHSSHDKPFVRQLADALTKVGVDAWFDEWEIGLGKSLSESIKLAVAKSRYVGVVISPEMIRSEWCATELEQAAAREKREGSTIVIPLLYQHAPLPKSLEGLLYADFSANFLIGIVKLSQLVHGLTEASVAQAVAASPPSNMADVWSILNSCDWDGVSLFEPKDMAELEERLLSLKIEYDKDDAGVVGLSDGDIMNDQLSDLKVIKIMREFIANS